MVLEHQDVFFTRAEAYNSCDSSPKIRMIVSVADPGSGALLTPGSQIPNPFFWSLVTVFCVKNTIILRELAQMVRTCICEKFLYFDADKYFHI